VVGYQCFNYLQCFNHNTLTCTAKICITPEKYNNVNSVVLFVQSVSLLHYSIMRGHTSVKRR